MPFRTDGELARAAETYGNVVTACAAEFGRILVPYGDKDYYAEDFSLLSFEAPYEGLRQATRQGHINAMMDPNGISLRIPGAYASYYIKEEVLVCSC